jgi:hypothetical protein
MHGSVALDVVRHTLAPALLYHPPAEHPCWQSHPLVTWEDATR